MSNAKPHISLRDIMLRSIFQTFGLGGKRSSHYSNSENTTQKPPPFDSLLQRSRDDISKSPPPSISIKYTDPPQWLWSREQSRAWLLPICTDFLNRPMPESEMISLGFKGCGPTIYMMNFMAWREVFLDNEEGDAVYAMVLGMRGKEEAVPTGMEIRHGNTREELNGFGKEAAERDFGGESFDGESLDGNTTEALEMLNRCRKKAAELSLDMERLRREGESLEGEGLDGES